MRFTSLIVELIRMRSGLVFWLVALGQAALWFVVPMLLYASPPGDLPMVLAVGREYVMGSDLGPPLAFWLADLAFRLAGQHMFGVYLLAQVCFVVTFWALFRLARLIVGPQHAVLAIVLTATIVAFSFPGVEFGPDLLARPLWALVLLNGWRIVGLGRREAWFALSMNAGLLLLTTPAAPLLLALLLAFALATQRGRRMLLSLDPLFALAVVAVLVLPYGIFVARGGLPPVNWPSLADIREWPLAWLKLVGGALLTLAGIAILMLANWSRLSRNPEEAPIIYRRPVEPLARAFVLYFLFAPALTASLIAVALGRSELFGGDGVALLMAGLAAVLAGGDLLRLRRQRILRIIWTWIIAAPALLIAATTLIQPWIFADEIRTMTPAAAMGDFFGDAYQRRTGQPLRIVAGDPRLASLIGFAAPSQPHLLLDGTPERTPWISADALKSQGGLVVWRAQDTAGTPPSELAARFPGLVPEVPRSFQRLVKGRQPIIRVGWAIVRPPSR